MKNDVARHAKNCRACAQRKSPKNMKRVPLHPIEVTRPLEIIGVDFVGPLPTTEKGNRYIMVMQDHFTRWPLAYASLEATAKTVVEGVQSFARDFGFPDSILSDRGLSFVSKLVKKVCKKLKIFKHKTTAYCSETNGLCERFHGTMKPAISVYINKGKNDLDLFLDDIVAAYRTTPHTVTKETPAFFMFARDFVFPDSILSDRGSSIVSNLKKKVCKKLKIFKHKTTAYCSETNGLCERFHGTMKPAISVYINKGKNDLDLFLDDIVAAYRTTPHTVTKETPAFFMFGRDFGFPDSILSDRGSSFVSKLVKKVCKKLKIFKHKTTAYCSETNGLCERFHGTMKPAISVYINKGKNDWDLFLDDIVAAYCTTPHTVTKETPTFFMFGRQFKVLPSEEFRPPAAQYSDDFLTTCLNNFRTACTSVRKLSKTEKDRRKVRFDKKSMVPDFKVGESVFVKVCERVTGLDKEHWKGPYLVEEIVSPENV